MKTTLISIAILTLAVGCEKKEDKGAASGDDKGAATKGDGDKGGAAAKMEWMKIGSLGVEAEVPGGTTVDDKSKGAGFPTATIWASPTTFVSAQNDMFWPADAAKAKAEIEKDPNKFQKFTKEEAAGDTFHLEFTLESMMDKTPIYGVKIRKKVGDKLFDCGSNSGSEAERAKVTKICNSLRAAK